jgi:hypothetical protein
MRLPPPFRRGVDEQGEYDPADQVHVGKAGDSQTQRQEKRREPFARQIPVARTAACVVFIACPPVFTGQDKRTARAIEGEAA